MSFDREILPWEVFVVAAIAFAMLIIFSLVRWVFLPRPKHLPSKRIIFFMLCLGLVFYAYRFVDNFPAKFRAGIDTNSASTSDTPAFDDLRTPRFAKNRTEVFEAALRAIEAQRGWTLTNRADSDKSLQVEISVMLGIFTDQMRISFIEEGGKTRVDLQSQSLKSSADFGANRRHILQFIKALEQQLGVRRE